MHKHGISIAKAFALVAFLAWGLLFPLHSNGIEPQLSPQPWVIKRYPIDKNKLNGNRQFSNVKSSTNRPFVVQVTDTLGNAISRAEVYFTITSWPDKANGQRLTTYSTVTDSLGQAHTTIFLGDTEGEYIVSAGVKSSIPNQVALFTATARKSNWLTMLVVGLLGGLALFLLGINAMSKGLRQSSGNKIRSILGTMNKTSLRGTVFGALMTIITQSSSATTVMILGFVRSGLLPFEKTIGMIFGAAIGTTITVQLIAFNLSDYSLLVVALGFGIYTFSKREGLRSTGEAVMGFGILFYGMYIMSQAMSPLRSYDPFIEILSHLERPLLGILAGTLFTALIQSSAAFIGIMLTLATQGLLSLESAIPLLLGANLGTTVTSILASIGAGREAKKVALAYSIFKVFGILLLVGLIDPFAWLIRYITTPDGTSTITSIPREIANAHTVFNVLITLVVLPFSMRYAAFIERITPKERSKKPEYKAKHLDRNLLGSPAMALNVAKQEVIEMGQLVQQMVDDIITPFTSKDAEPLKRISRSEKIVDSLRDQINSYLIELTRQDIKETHIQEAFQIMYATKEFEQVADIVSKNLAQRAEWWLQSGYEFSPEGTLELKEFHLLTQKQLKRALAVFTTLNLQKAKKMSVKYQQYKEVGLELERQHFDRLKKDVDKSVLSSKTHLELVSMLRTIGSHANNIAQIILDWPGNKEHS